MCVRILHLTLSFLCFLEIIYFCNSEEPTEQNSKQANTLPDDERNKRDAEDTYYMNELGKFVDNGNVGTDFDRHVKELTEKRFIPYDELQKRIRLFIGKREADDLEKRMRYFVGKRDDAAEKRMRYFVGKRDFADDMADEEKRMRYFVGKRDGATDDFIKRIRYFVGKRSARSAPDNQFMKRMRYFVGKREADEDGYEKRMRYFVGKREDDDYEKRMRYFVGKRPMRYFVGKRINDEIFADDGLEAEKRMRYFVGKKSDGMADKRMRYFVGKRAYADDSQTSSSR